MDNIIWILSVSIATLAYSFSGKQGFIAFFEKFFCSNGIFPLLHTFLHYFWFGFCLDFFGFLIGRKSVMSIIHHQRRVFLFVFLFVCLGGFFGFFYIYIFYYHSWVHSKLGTWSKANCYKLWLTAAIQNAIGELSELQRQKPQSLAGNPAVQPFDWICYFSPVLPKLFDA